jgi:hypothetical protein
MLSIAFVVLQYVVSAKAGFVNFIDGSANVSVHQQVAEGAPIETYDRSHVEVLLNPGSFLRLGQNSTAIFDSVDLTNLKIRIEDGSAIVEAAESSKRVPIQVTAGELRTSIVAPGVYRFSPGSARVLEGRLDIVGSPIVVKKGHEITDLAGSYTQNTVPVTFTDDLDQWSQARSQLVSRANAFAYAGQPRPITNGSLWYFSPFLAGYTFIPFRTYRSYYGYSFIPVTSFRPVIASRVPLTTTRTPTSTTPAQTSTTTAASSTPPPSTGVRGAPTTSRPAIKSAHTISRSAHSSSHGSAHR